MSGTIFGWKLEGAGLTGGCRIFFVSGHAKQINRKELIAGLRRAVGFGEHRNRADSDVDLHKGSVVAASFNLS